MSEPNVHLRKACGGSTVAGFHWDADGAVVEVPYALAVELLAIPDGGFTEAPAEPEHRPEHAGAGEDAGPAARAPRKPPAHARKPAAKPSGKG